MSHLKIVDFKDEYRSAFRELNKEWIDQYFVMEESDYASLDHPEQIIDNGGFILVALYDGEPAGVCALVKLINRPQDYELAKMAVSPRFQGKRIGWQLGMAVINKAKLIGARSIFLESNTILAPAINLYRKLGFVEIEGPKSKYQRSNIQMELILS